jgi:hypothetical protein
MGVGIDGFKKVSSVVGLGWSNIGEFYDLRTRPDSCHRAQVYGVDYSGPSFL